MSIIKYGRVVVETAHVDYKQVRRTVKYTERVAVKSKKDVLKEILAHHKKYLDEEISNIGIQVVEKNGQPQFVDKIWSVVEILG